MRRRALLLTALLLAVGVGTAQDMPSGVLLSPAGLLWSAEEARLRGLFSGQRPADFEALLGAARARLIAVCQAALRDGQECGRDLALRELRVVTDALNDGHTGLPSLPSDARYGLTLVQSGATDDELGVVRVAVVVPRSPAEGVGLKRGDQLLAVAGQPVVAAHSALSGRTGPVVVTVQRGAQRFEVTLNPYRPATPQDFLVPLPTLGYAGFWPVIRYPSFNGVGTAQAFAVLVRQVMALQKPGLVVDLRENGGGLLTECLLAASLVAGEVQVHLDRGPFERRWHYRADSGVLETHALTFDGWLPHSALTERLHFAGRLAVLVNRRSASCAEVFANLARTAGGRVRVYGEPTRGIGNSFVQQSPGSTVQVNTGALLDGFGTPLSPGAVLDVPLRDDLDRLGQEGVDVILERAVADLQDPEAWALGSEH